jgi:HSP20 family protein
MNAFTREETFMANVTRYDPFDLLEGVMKSVLRPGYEAAVDRQRNAWAGSIPIDVVENDMAYVVWAELPGVKKEDVNVSIAGNQVSLTAELKQEKSIDEGQRRENVLLQERRTGTYARQLQFAAEIDNEKAEAAYRDGVLQLTLPKKESAQVRRLAIN